jgi:hypothetical protein
LVSFGFLERVFGFLVLDAEKQKKIVFFGFWSLLTSKANIFLEFFWFLELATLRKPKKTNSLSRKPKETKKTPGKESKLFPETNNSVQRCFFLVFGFLVVSG